MSKRVLVYTRHVKQWEICTAVANRMTGVMQWERCGDGGSYVCKVGEELATAPLPPKPSPSK